MKKIIMGLSMISLVALLSACGGGEKAAPAPAPAKQETPAAPAKQETPAPAAGNTANASAADNTFKQNCAACHGVDLKGAVGPDLTKVGSRLNKDQILEVINKGRNAMPGGVIKGADADAVATWLAAKK
ncbi:MAG TPA: cytochrome c [Bacillota bacterium]|nr:cytochrome c [Bacillota bacterium]